MRMTIGQNECAGIKLRSLILVIRRFCELLLKNSSLKGGPIFFKPDGTESGEFFESIKGP